MNQFIFLIKDLQEKSFINIGSMKTPTHDRVRKANMLVSNDDANPNAPYIVVTMAGNSLLDILKPIE